MKARIRKKNFGRIEHSQHVKLTTSLLSVSQWSRQWGILNISQPYRPPRPVAGLALHVSISRKSQFRRPRCGEDGTKIDLNSSQFWLVMDT
jgi:hypothetical protein